MVAPEVRGNACGFHRAGDTVGAIPGPLAFAILVRETQPRPGEKKTLRATLSGLPAPFRKFLAAVAIFGSGDYSPTLLTLAAATLPRRCRGRLMARCGQPKLRPWARCS
jgi:hypothetical protein